MRIQITRPCYVAGENRKVDDIVEGKRADCMPAVGAKRAVLLSDVAEPSAPVEDPAPGTGEASAEPSAPAEDPAPGTGEASAEPSAPAEDPAPGTGEASAEPSAPAEPRPPETRKRRGGN